MSETLGRPAWLTAARTAAVFDALEAAGGPGCARFVGGCVRNALLGRKVDDLDIATPLTPDMVTAALRAARLKAVPTGVEHGTVTAISGGKPYEITTLRRDVETDGRRAVVAFTDDWGEDAARRDFTLNALYADRDGTVFDPLGSGEADAHAGRIVFVGDAATRIREDYLRILRFFRFTAWYGRGVPDAAAVAACAALKDGLGRLAAERVSKELLKLLAAADPRAAVALMAETGVMAEVLPEAAGLARSEALAALGVRDPELRLAALLPDDPAVAAAAARRLRLSNDLRDRLVAAADGAVPLDAEMTAAEARRALYALGARTVADRAWLGAAADPTAAAGWRRLAALAHDWRKPKFPLSGADVAALGVRRGPRVGALLREAEAWWVENDFPDDRLALLARLRAAAEAR
ncbi:CCA tRNA nucleotidyltransferase [Phenylobacterium sp.]|uniref:CCA tRNA nucleotidyltransferase n=1 Tax=Phenylobacterium sp. TaxID=1871053 RepID=UPI002F400B45